MADWQVTASSSIAWAGTTWETHVVPPSPVVRISADSDWDVCALLTPTATHATVVGHDTDARIPVLEGSASAFQVAPPSLVLRATPDAMSGSPPTATHDAAEAQSSPKIGPVPAGTVCVVQVVPPSVVARISPSSADCAALMVAPPA